MPWQPPEHPTAVRAKFFVQSVTIQSWGVEVTLNVVTRGQDNHQWSAATPSGSMKMVVKNEVAAEQFWPGQEWLVDLTPVPAEQVGQEGMDTPA